jgi:hypothetical protein
MLETGKEAWIANLSSIGGFGMMPTQTAYIMTKHAVEAFTECLYLEMEVAKAPIHVSSVIPGMVKTSIFEAEHGAGEPGSAARYRTVMRELMKNHGMELDEGCRRILEQIAGNKFWVSTQPEMTEQTLAGRIEFFREQHPPRLVKTAARIDQSSRSCRVWSVRRGRRCRSRGIVRRLARRCLSRARKQGNPNLILIMGMRHGSDTRRQMGDPGSDQPLLPLVRLWRVG